MKENHLFWEVTVHVHGCCYHELEYDLKRDKTELDVTLRLINNRGDHICFLLKIQAKNYTNISTNLQIISYTLLQKNESYSYKDFFCTFVILSHACVC